MKARHLRQIVNQASKLEPPRTYDEAVEQARETQRQVYGPACAAGIIWRFRQQIKKHGVAQFQVWEKKYKEAHAKRPWFFIGFDYLRGAKNWHGVVLVEGNKLVYRLFWLKHPTGKALSGIAS